MFLLTNPLIQAYKDSDCFGKIIFLILILLSIITWTIFWQKTSVQKKFFKTGIELKNTFLGQKSLPLSLDNLPPHNPFTDLYKSIKRISLELLNKNKDLLEPSEEHLVILSNSDIDVIENQILSLLPKYKHLLEKNNFILSTIVSLAPFLGLLGTVWGLLLAFSALGTTQNSSTIMSGLSTSLATTVLGLLVAIPALIAYNYLKTLTTSLLIELEFFGFLTLNAIELKYKKQEKL